MAKPSVTNIRPPTTPPKTSWDLDADHNDPFYADFGSAGFTNLTGQINLTETGLTQAVLNDYQYVFFGVNGGMDETVIGRQEMAGIIVTGNGKDNITGGNWDDLLFSGNGSDIAHGGKGDDIIFGENGPDQVFGDADNDQIFGGNGPDKIIGGTDRGEFQATTGGVTLKDGVHVYDGTLADLPKDSNDTTQPTDKVLNTSPPSFLVDSGKVYEVFDVKLTDTADPGTGSGSGPGEHTLSTEVTVAVYKGGVGNATLADLLYKYSTNLDDGYHTQFAVEIKDDPNYANAKVYVFLGDLDPNNPDDAAILNDPAHSAQTNAAPLPAFDTIATKTTDSFTFVAGDILTGGNPDATLLPVGLSTTNVYDQSFKVGVSDGAPDVFIYNKIAGVYDGVDVITDYNKLEGDVLELHGIAQSSVRYFEEIVGGQNNLIIAFDNGSGSLVADAAIKLLGVQHASDVGLLFT
jgi:hypothetical protein